MILEPKLATLSMTLMSDTGYNSRETTRVSMDQYEAVLRILNGRPTPDEARLGDALLAIEARINGVWDHPALVAMGELSIDTDKDIKRFAAQALETK